MKVTARIFCTAAVCITWAVSVTAQGPEPPRSLPQTASPAAHKSFPIGTQATTENYVAKFGQNGQLTDSSIYDTGSVVDVRQPLTSDLLMRVWNTYNGADPSASGAKLRVVAGTGATAQWQMTDSAGWLASIAVNRNTGMQFRITPPTAENYESDLNASTRMTITRSGNVGIGTTNPQYLLHVIGDAKFTGTVYGGNIQASYQDLAEWVPAAGQMEPGTVVVLNRAKSNEVMAAAQAYDTAVAGVVSAQPGVLLGESGPHKVKIATTGRVRVRVDATSAPIAIGDLLATSDVPGTAMRSEPIEIRGRKFHQPGTVIGKALEPLASGRGEILVLLSLQ